MSRLLLCAVIAGMLLLASGVAWALSPGGTVYVRARDTRVLADSRPGAKAVGEPLQPGASLVWVARDEKNPRYHQVKTAKGELGVVYFANISAAQPSSEIKMSGDRAQQVDPHAFASQGAAARGLTEGALRYGADRSAGVAEGAGDRLAFMEEFALRVIPAQVLAHRKAAGLPLEGEGVEQ